MHQSTEFDKGYMCLSNGCRLSPKVFSDAEFSIQHMIKKHEPVSLKDVATRIRQFGVEQFNFIEYNLNALKVLKKNLVVAIDEEIERTKNIFHQTFESQVIQEFNTFFDDGQGIMLIKRLNKLVGKDLDFGFLINLQSFVDDQTLKVNEVFSESKAKLVQLILNCQGNLDQPSQTQMQSQSQYQSSILCSDQFQEIIDSPSHDHFPQEGDKNMFQRTVIIDNGSYMIKAGLSLEKYPRYCFHTIVGTQYSEAQQHQRIFFGNEARIMPYLSYPMKNGKITNWPKMEYVWEHTFQQIGVSPNESPAFLVESPQTNKSQREKMAQIFFEGFQVPKLYIANGALLSLLASGRTTGVVVDSGEGVTHVVPIYEQSVLQLAQSKMNQAGKSITDWLQKTIKQILNLQELDRNSVNYIKEKLGYVAPDNLQEFLASINDPGSKVRLPDGRSIILRQEKFKCTELMFTPKLNGDDGIGLHQIINNSIMMCDYDVRRQLYANIVPTGGNTEFPGFPERLSTKVKSQASQSMQVKVCALPNRQFIAWTGGSILQSLSSFDSKWITKENYEEYGAQVINQLAI